jgi:hypothetical protein
MYNCIPIEHALSFYRSLINTAINQGWLNGRARKKSPSSWWQLWRGVYGDGVEP